MCSAARFPFCPEFSFSHLAKTTEAVPDVTKQKRWLDFLATFRAWILTSENTPRPIIKPLKMFEMLVIGALAVPEVTAVKVDEVDLSCFDQLLEDREVWSGDSHGSENDVTGAVAGLAFAGVP